MYKNIKLAMQTFLVYGIPILIWSVVPFTKNFWGSFSDDFIFNFLFNGKMVFVSMGLIFDFLFLYCIYLLFFRKTPAKENERVFLIGSGIAKISRWIFIDLMKKELNITKEEKVSVLFYFVKLYFTPVMIHFLIGNTKNLIRAFTTITAYYKTVSLSITKEIILSHFLPLIFYFILTIDTLIFSFGYLVESSKLKNIVKSVEPTALGWFVAIAWYPPLNDFTGKILGWYTSDFSNFGNVNINLITGIISIISFGIFVWASVSLGFKASNLTNRGIVSKGPYKYVRHPAYSSKNLSWWLMAIPFIQASGFIAIFSMGVVTFFYFLRALTEERHLMQDPDYVDYAKKVKYMFIPGIF